MMVENASLIYINYKSERDWQCDMRSLVRPLIDSEGITIEFTNNSGRETDIEDEDQFSVDMSPSEAREVAHALILAAETIEKRTAVVTTVDAAKDERLTGAN